MDGWLDDEFCCPRLSKPLLILSQLDVSLYNLLVCHIIHLEFQDWGQIPTPNLRFPAVVSVCLSRRQSRTDVERSRASEKAAEEQTREEEQRKK